MATLTELAGRVALNRKVEAEVRAEYMADKAAFDAAHVALAERIRAAETATYNAEMALREAVVAEYMQTGSKKFAMATIRVAKRLVYDAIQAFEWALKHQQCLNLNAGAFEKVVKALPDDKELTAIARIEEEPTAALNSNLSEFLGVDEAGGFT